MGFKELFYQRLRSYAFVVTQVPTIYLHQTNPHPSTRSPASPTSSHNMSATSEWQCEGSSMLPTLNPHGDILLQESLSVKRNPPRLDRGDLVISISPVDPSRLICKRLIGLPGDTICIDPTTTTKHVLIPPGHVWLQGDNFMNSRDSRMYGPVPMGLLRARVIARVWPLADAKWIRNPFTYIDNNDE
ncbi:Mitochondrial inner membrane protease subunit 1 [Ceratobasidium theobromae]|uniref:Mitochondrial inner membrane protease subunit 1 n=1 Tax=Ceratobasidium theobromae TaxID=1582974 RepID=A0A5N5QKJ2_9AGAM|nr:Mitochondrial inner membrane protease subunit 1 [Ceratobasidium theobromae]